MERKDKEHLDLKSESDKTTESVQPDYNYIRTYNNSQESKKILECLKRSKIWSLQERSRLKKQGGREQ